MQTAVEAAGFAVHTAWTAATTAVPIIQHGQVSGGGLGGSSLGGGATGMTHHGHSRLTQEQVSKVGFLQSLLAVMSQAGEDGQTKRVGQKEGRGHRVEIKAGRD